MREIISAALLFGLGYALVGALDSNSFGSLDISIIFLSSVIFGSALFLGNKISQLKK